MQKPTVLIVDSHEQFRVDLMSALAQEGCEVLGARSGQRGLEMLRQARPSLAVIDMELPDLDGIEALRRFKETRPETEVIMIACNEFVESPGRSIKGCGFDTQTEPLSLKRLVRAIKKALEEIGA